MVPLFSGKESIEDLLKEVILLKVLRRRVNL
jgi:hypothetical protein